MNENEVTLEKLVKNYVEDNIKIDDKEDCKNFQKWLINQMYQDIVTEVIEENKSKIIEDYKQDTQLERKKVELKEFEQLTINTIILGFLVGMLVNSMTSLFEYMFINLSKMPTVPWWGYFGLGVVIVYFVEHIRKLLKGKLLEEWLNDLIERKND